MLGGGSILEAIGTLLGITQLIIRITFLRSVKKQRSSAEFGKQRTVFGNAAKAANG